jgi:TusA-related sulfurtransferase
MRHIIDEVGFVCIESGPVRYDAFSGAPSESSAAEFGTEGITVRAWKPHATLAKLRSSLNSTPFVASTTVESRAGTPSARASLLRRQPTETGKYPARLPDEARTLMAESNPLPRANAVLDAPGQGCATLTPLIRARIREMDSGGILEVRTDDPTAIDNLQAWSRLTGNELVAVSVDDPRNQRFFIRKK